MDSFCSSNTYVQSSSWEIIPAFAWAQPKKKHQLYSNSSTFKSQEEQKNKPRRIDGKRDISQGQLACKTAAKQPLGACPWGDVEAIPHSLNQLPRERRAKLQRVSSACTGVAARLPGLHHSFSTWKQSCKRQGWIITESSVVPMKSATFSMQNPELWGNQHCTELRNWAANGREGDACLWKFL